MAGAELRVAPGREGAARRRAWPTCGGHRTHRHAIAALLLACDLATGPLRAGVALASAGPPADGRAAAGTRVTEEPDTLGSAARPYPLRAFETRALRRGRAGPIDQFVVRVGPLRAVLHGVPEAVVSAGGALTTQPAEALSSRGDLYSGAALEMLGDRFGGVFVDGGRVLLRDPRETLQRGGVEGEYWTSSAGIELRF